MESQASVLWPSSVWEHVFNQSLKSAVVGRRSSSELLVSCRDSLDSTYLINSRMDIAMYLWKLHDWVISPGVTLQRSQVTATWSPDELPFLSLSSALFSGAYLSNCSMFLHQTWHKKVWWCTVHFGSFGFLTKMFCASMPTSLASTEFGSSAPF